MLAISVAAGLLALVAGADAQTNTEPSGPGLITNAFGCGGEFGSDDSFEDNDTRETASSITLPFGATGLMACLDDDWFSFPLSVGAEVQVDASFANAGGDINIALFDSDGTRVAQSFTTSDNEKITHTVATTGEFAVQVYTEHPPESYKGNTYRLEVIVSCLDDAFEENDHRGGGVPVGISVQ